ncbi:MAG: ArsR/SmtB family transcription factor [Halodesulfurarchaeum sp.]
MSSPLTEIRPGEDAVSTEPRVLSLDGADAEEVFEALSSGTRRRMLERLYEAPSTPSELAETTDTSLQNVHYHLEKLADVDLIEPVGTRYSEKGAEMSVFGPTSEPLVIVEGESEREEMESRVGRLVGAVSTVVGGGVLAQYLLGGQRATGYSSTAPGVMTATVRETAASEPGLFEGLANALAEPGAMVLVGGLLAVLVLEIVYRRGSSRDRAG